jgi:hypothetical protein
MKTKTSDLCQNLIIVKSMELLLCIICNIQGDSKRTHQLQVVVQNRLRAT